MLAQFAKAPVRICFCFHGFDGRRSHTRGATIWKRIRGARSGGRTCQRSLPHICGESSTRQGSFSACVSMALFCLWQIW
jgi:hypothetical protein